MLLDLRFYCQPQRPFLVGLGLLVRLGLGLVGGLGLGRGFDDCSKTNVP